MSITAASIDATGNYLLLTGTWARSTGFQADGSATANSDAAYPFPLFTLDIDGTPRVKLNVARPGYIRSGGQAVSATRAKTIIGYKMMRGPVPYDPPSGTSTVPTFDAAYVPNNIALDEVDNGSTRTVKILLIRRVFVGDTVTLDVLANWRTGESAASAITVDVSAVTAVIEKPVLRPATGPLRVVSGTFRYDPAIVSHHPEGFDGVCAVKYTLTDGTNSTTPVWVIGQTVSSLHGDNWKCWGTDLTPTGLNTGLINVNIEVYPWTGAMRSFSTATPTQILADTTVCESGVPMCYDPAGTRYPDAFVAIDPVSGTTTAAAGMVQLTSALALGVAAASKPKDFTTACQAIYLFNRTAAGVARSADKASIIIPGAASVMGYISGTTLTVTSVIAGTIAVGGTIQQKTTPIVVPAATTVSSFGTGTGGTGTYTLSASATLGSSGAPVAILVGGVALGATAVTSGLVTAETWLNIIGDPTLTAADARSRCLLLCNLSAAITPRASWFRWQNMVIGAYGKEINANYNWLDNVDIVSQNGTSTTPPTRGVGTAGHAKTWLTNVKFAGHGIGYSGAAAYTKLARNYQSDRRTAAICLINYTKLPGVSADPATSAYPLATDADAMADVVRFNVDGRGCSGITTPYDIPICTAATPATITRFMNVNVLVENNNGNLTMVSSTDALTYTSVDNYWEGVTLVGDRVIYDYNEPVCTTVSDVATLNNVSNGQTWRNFYTDRFFCKTEVYDSPAVRTIRQAAGGTGQLGYAKVRRGTLPFVMGANQFNGVDGLRFPNGASSGGTQEGRGLNAKVNPNSNQSGANTALSLNYPGFTNDACYYGTRAGFGDYRPGAGSPLLNMATAANTDRDLAGVTRGATFAAGALEPSSISVTAPATSFAIALTFALTAAAGGALAPANPFSITTTIATASASGSAITPAAMWSLPIGFTTASAIGAGGGIAPSVAWSVATSIATTSARGSAVAPNNPLTVSLSFDTSIPIGGASVVNPAWSLVVAGTFPVAIATNPVLTDYSPVTLAEAKAFLRVENSDDDALIGALINAARDYIESAHGIVCAPRSSVFNFTGFNARLELLRGPVRGVTGVAYADTAGAAQSLASTAWRVAPRNGVVTVQPAFGTAWPCASADSIEVTADIGYASNADVPPVIRFAAQVMITSWYQVREVGEVPAGALAMLSGYRAVMV